MEKILLKKIGVVLGILSSLLFALFSGIIFITERKEAVQDLEEMIEQVEIIYNKSKLDTEKTIKIFKKDYLNRAYAVDFMLKNNSNANYNFVTLKKITKLMEIDFIHIIDDTGKIVLSSEKKFIGLNLKRFKESEPFVELIDSNDAKANVIQLNGVSILDKNPKTYIGVKSSSKKYSVVQIGLNQGVLNNLIVNNSISSIVRNTPTIKEKAVFVINNNTGEVDGITRNNEQELKFDNTNSKKKSLTILRSANHGKQIKINDTMKFIKTKIVDDKIIGAFVDANIVFEKINIQIMYLFIGILIISLCIFVIIKYSLKKYILKDIFSIESSIKELIIGNVNVSFNTKHNTEFKKITSALNDLKDSLQYKSQRMTRIISSLDSHVAVFECLYKINQNYFSDDIQSILDIDNDTWYKINSSSKGFEGYLKSLISHSQDGIISLKNDRFIQIVSFERESEFYGIIMDKTEEIKLKKEIKEELLTAQKVAEIDPLTQLSNRLGVEKIVKKSLQENPGEGTMIIFDLDNFKSVNDQKGHLEGDRVLKKFAHCLKMVFRPSDVVGRMGGDEFLVFIPSNIPKKVMEDKLQSILNVVRMELSAYYHSHNLSTSIGVAYVDINKNSYKDLYLCTDVGLYIAKALGKDRYYINEENIRCMRKNCINCTKDCKKRELLGL